MPSIDPLALGGWKTVSSASGAGDGPSVSTGSDEAMDAIGASLHIPGRNSSKADEVVRVGQAAHRLRPSPSPRQ